MKEIILILTLCSLASHAQTIRIADNNPNRPAGANVFSTLQAAINAAAPGDIVYVQPSTTTYGDVIINKRITLRGIGFNTGKDLGLQSVTGDITLTNTVDNTTNASGTTIEGICVCTSNARINLGVPTGSFGYTLQNITVSNCGAGVQGLYRVSGYAAAENIVVNDCFLGIWANGFGTVTNLLVYRNFLYNIIIEGGSLSSAIFSNNIFDRGNDKYFGRSAAGGQPTAINSLIITNNNFLGETDITGSQFITWDLKDAVVSNNIFYGCSPRGNTAPYVFERNTFANNLSFGTSNDALPPAGTGVGNTGANNKPGQNPLFVNAPFNTLWATTWDFTLQATSPAKDAGTDGTDIGITGGAYPVSKNINLSATQAPVIMQFNPAALVPQNQPVKANIKVKSN